MSYVIEVSHGPSSEKVGDVSRSEQGFPYFLPTPSQFQSEITGNGLLAQNFPKGVAHLGAVLFKISRISGRDHFSSRYDVFYHFAKLKIFGVNVWGSGQESGTQKVD